MAITLQLVTSLPQTAAASASAASTPGNDAAASALPFAAMMDDLLKPLDLAATAVLPGQIPLEEALPQEAALSAPVTADASTQALLASLVLLPQTAPRPDKPVIDNTEQSADPTVLGASITDAGSAEAQSLPVVQAAPDEAAPLPFPPLTATSVQGQSAVSDEPANQTAVVAEAAVDSPALPVAAANLAAPAADTRVRLPVIEPYSVDTHTSSEQPVADAALARSLSPVTQTVTHTQAASPAPAQVAQYVIPEPVGGSRWADALSQRALILVDQQMKSAEMHLNPPHLGPLEVKLALDGDKASLSFTTHQAAVREAVQQSLPRLQQVFADNGLSQLNVHVHLGQQQQEQQAQQFQQGRGYSVAADTREVSVEELEAGVQASRWRSQTYAISRGGVDTFA